VKKIIVPVIAFLTLFLTACQVEDPSAKNLSQSPAASAQSKAQTPAKKDAGPKLTPAQKNAIDSANQYLSTSAFSRKGLIDQLKFEGYALKVAAFAVDYIHPDWNIQAVKSAKEYLSQGSFSRSGLIDQLKFEGFTTAQATYGVNKAYRG
jgi:hypothetical protein